MEEQYRRGRFNNNVDLFFPHTDYVLILRELLKLEQKKFASTAVSEPFGLAVLGSISAQNPRAPWFPLVFFAIKYYKLALAFLNPSSDAVEGVENDDTL